MKDKKYIFFALTVVLLFLVPDIVLSIPLPQAVYDTLYGPWIDHFFKIVAIDIIIIIFYLKNINKTD